MKDGTVFELGDRTLEYIYTPGHSQDCIMLYDRPAGILLCGDMILVPLRNRLIVLYVKKQPAA